MSNAPPPITGLIRFSFFGMNDTRQKHHDMDVAFGQVYNSTRMEARLYLFENLCLPSLRAQTDQDIRIVILTSEIMPKPYKDRLRNVTTDVPNIQIYFSQGREIRGALKPYMRDHEIKDRAVNFRLGEDDAISCQYIKRLRQVSISMPERSHISFPKGIISTPNPAVVQVSGVCTHLCPSPSLVRITGQSFRKNPYKTMHDAVWKTFPTETDPGFAAYIMTLHGHNDTAARIDVRNKNVRENSYRMGRREGNKAVQRQLAENIPHLTQDRLQTIMANQILTQPDHEPEETH
ncbi:MAG: glycosyltransferase [Tateyamaria sp.]|uniref:glycosyltransferase n=1 Tax=Tateyamaria sp. TaxID=1929288 RepID=UPI0032825B95